MGKKHDYNKGAQGRRSTLRAQEDEERYLLISGFEEQISIIQKRDPTIDADKIEGMTNS